MKIYKPDDTLFMTSYSELANQPSLTLTVGYVYQRDGHLLNEQEAWKWLPTLFTDEAFDLGQAKPGGGFGVAGDACAPHGQTVQGLTVRAGIANLKNSLLVFGDRYWTLGVSGWQATTAAPFSRMPIHLSRAFGAPDWNDNPYGQGYCRDPNACEGIALPNIESPTHPILKPSDTPPPATLGAHPMGSQIRNRWLGPFDDKWLQKNHPYLPAGSHANWFNRFDECQCRTTYWQGNETWFAENMHPHHPYLQGQLPGLRPRILVSTNANLEDSIELTPNLDTIWLIPNDERVILLYRASIKTKYSDGSDVKHVAIFTEYQSQPQQDITVLHKRWAESLDLSAAPVVGTAAAATAADALASEAPDVDALKKEAEQFAAELQTDIDQTIAQSTQEVEQDLTEAGYDLEQLKATASDSQSFKNETPLPDAVSQVNDDNSGAFEAALNQDIEDSISQSQQEAEQYLQEQGFDVEELKTHASANDEEIDLVDMVKSMIDGLNLDEAAKAARLEEFLAFNAEMSALEDNLEASTQQASPIAANDDKVSGISPEGIAAATAAVAMTPTTVVGSSDKPLLQNREQFFAHLHQNQSVKFCHFQGLQLENTDLSGLDARSSLFEDCYLKGAKLDAALLANAVFRHCVLDEAILENADLSSAQIEHCSFQRAILTGANLSETRINQSDWSQAVLDGVDCQDAHIQTSKLASASLKKAKAQRARFEHCEMAQIDANQADFLKADFSHCNLQSACFNSAFLNEATLLACDASLAQFQAATMSGFRTLENTKLDQSDFSKASLQGASLQNTSFFKAHLRETCLDNALIRACDLSQTDGWRLSAREADFCFSLIQDASWRGANLMFAILTESQWFNVDLSGANLHAAQTRRATVQGLQLEDALLTRCRLLQEYSHD